MYKAAVIGDFESIYGFGALGLDLYPVATPEEAEKLLHRLRDQAAVIYLTEALADALGDRLDRYDETKLPAIILIPGVTGDTGEGMKRVHRSVERAVGSDIFAGERDEL